MIEFARWFTPWLADYSLLSTLLLGVVLLACWRIEQPARRQALARPTLIALFLLACLCALPGWSLVHLLTQAESDTPMQTGEALQIAIPSDRQETAKLLDPGPVFTPQRQPPAAENETSASRPTPSTPIVWTSWLVISYLSGSLLTILWQASGGVLARRLVRQATLASPELQKLFTEIHDDAKRLPTLYVSDRIQAPAALGVFRPIILLPPQSAGEGLGEGNCCRDTLRPILAHELAHIRHGDLHTLAAARLLTILLWPQPLFWLLRRRVRLDQETLADAAATEVISRNDYAEQLVAWARVASSARIPRLASSVGLWESASELKERVAALLDERFSIVRGCSLRWRVGTLVALIGFALALSVVSIWPGQLLVAIENGVKAKSSNASKEFSFGSKVEVLAIGTHDEQPQRWWDATGKPLDSVPFEWKKDGNISAPDSLWRRVVIRTAHLPVDADVSWKLDSSWATGKVTIDGEQDSEGYLTRYFAISDNQETFDFRIGIAKGPWKTKVKSRPSSSFSFGEGNKNDNGSGVIFSRATETVLGTVVVVTHNYSEHDVRVVAIDSLGKLHESSDGGAAGAQGFYQMRRTFPTLPLGHIDRFEFQVRDYEWVEFEGLPANSRDNSATPEPELKDGNQDRTSQLFSLIDALQLAADRGVIRQMNPRDAEREPRMPKDLAMHRAYSFDPDTVFSRLETVFDEEAGSDGAFNGFLEGLERDPYGPQIEAKSEVIDNPAGRIVVLATNQDDPLPYPERWLIAVGAKNAEKLSLAVDKFMGADPKASLDNISGSRVWMVSGDGEKPPFAVDKITKESSKGSNVELSNQRALRRSSNQENLFVCVSHEQLLISPQAALLAKVFDSESSGIKHVLADRESEHDEIESGVEKQIQPWSIQGKVTDSNGNGLADVQIRAATGWGALLGGATTTTDEQGRYVLHFGPGIYLQISEDSPRGVGVQAAAIFASKPGWFETNLSRQGDLLMTDLTPERAWEPGPSRTSR